MRVAKLREYAGGGVALYTGAWSIAWVSLTTCRKRHHARITVRMTTRATGLWLAPARSTRLRLSAHDQFRDSGMVVDVAPCASLRGLTDDHAAPSTLIALQHAWLIACKHVALEVPHATADSRPVVLATSPLALRLASRAADACLVSYWLNTLHYDPLEQPMNTDRLCPVDEALTGLIDAGASRTGGLCFLPHSALIGVTPPRPVERCESGDYFAHDSVFTSSMEPTRAAAMTRFCLSEES